MARIRIPAMTVTMTVTVEITTTAPRGVVARASAWASQRSILVSSAMRVDQLLVIPIGWLRPQRRVTGHALVDGHSHGGEAAFGARSSASDAPSDHRVVGRAGGGGTPGRRPSRRHPGTLDPPAATSSRR